MATYIIKKGGNVRGIVFGLLISVLMWWGILALVAWGLR